MKLEILCAGIGGRGVLLASTILIEAAIAAGLKASASDEYGMSQRGGSVVSLVKIGDFKSPLIGRENAGILLSFEESEFYRNLTFLKRDGRVIVNTHKDALPGEVERLLKERNIRVYLVDGDGIAKQKGMIKASNIAILGYFSSLRIAPYSYENIKQTIVEKTKGKFLEKNLEIFEAGFRQAEGRDQ
jgi:indolepyruvate ferredoxin oxidoreductase beta subunit